MNNIDLIVEKLKMFSKACEEANKSTKETLRILESSNDTDKRTDR